MNRATDGTMCWATTIGRTSPVRGAGDCLDRHDHSRTSRERRRYGLRHHPGGQLLPFHQRRHAVAAVGALSDAEDRFPAGFLADRTAHHGLPGHGVAAAAAGRHVHRQAAAALFAAGRHGILAGRTDPACDRAQLHHAFDRRGLHRSRVRHLPSGILARGATCLGRALRACPVDVPGRRQFRFGDGASARRLHRRAIRAGKRRLVRAWRTRRDHRAPGRSAPGTARISRLRICARLRRRCSTACRAAG